MRVKLGEVFLQIRNGANIKQGEDGTGYPITRIETISNRTVDRNRMGYAGISDLQKYADYVLQDGDLLMSHINSETHLGKVALYTKHGDEAIIHGMNLLGLRPDKERISSQYAFYYLSSPDFLKQIPRITKKSVNQASFTVTALKELTFPLVDFEEQRRIAAVLDKVSGLIAMRKKQLQKLDDLVKARFVELFGENVDCPEQAFLEDIAEFVTVGIANSATHAYSDVGIVMLRNQNIKENYLDDADLIHITTEFAEKYGSKQLEENDILVIRTGYPGIACLVPRKYAGCQTFTTLIVRLKNSSRIHANYVCHYINSSFGKEYVESSKVGVAQQNFGAKALSKMPIRIPTIKKQEQFATFVEQTDKSKLTIQQSLDKLELMKKALMQKYFG